MNLPWPKSSFIPNLESEARFFAYMKSEEDRKERLSELFSELEEAERKFKKPVGQIRKYEKMHRGLIYVASKRKKSIVFHRQSGRRLGAIALPEEMIDLLRKDDHLDVIFGYRQAEWRVVSVFCIGSVMPPESELFGR